MERRKSTSRWRYRQEQSQLGGDILQCCSDWFRVAHTRKAGIDWYRVFQDTQSSTCPGRGFNGNAPMRSKPAWVDLNDSPHSSSLPGVSDPAVRRSGEPSYAASRPCQHGDGPGDVYQKSTCPRRSRVQALPRWLPTAMLNFETLVFDNETKVPRHCLIMFQISCWHLFQNLPWAVKKIKKLFFGSSRAFFVSNVGYIWFIVYKPLYMGPIFTTQLLIECFFNFHRIHVWYILFAFQLIFFGINVGKYFQSHAYGIYVLGCAFWMRFPNWTIWWAMNKNPGCLGHIGDNTTYDNINKFNKPMQGSVFYITNHQWNITCFTWVFESCTNRREEIPRTIGPRWQRGSGCRWVAWCGPGDPNFSSFCSKNVYLLVDPYRL